MMNFEPFSYFVSLKKTLFSYSFFSYVCCLCYFFKWWVADIRVKCQPYAIGVCIIFLFLSCTVSPRFRFRRLFLSMSFTSYVVCVYHIYRTVWMTNTQKLIQMYWWCVYCPYLLMQKFETSSFFVAFERRVHSHKSSFNNGLSCAIHKTLHF